MSDSVETKVVNQWKVALFRALKAKTNTLTANEYKIAVYLSADPHVQDVINKEKQNGK